MYRGWFTKEDLGKKRRKKRIVKAVVVCVTLFGVGFGGVAGATLHAAELNSERRAEFREMPLAGEGRKGAENFPGESAATGTEDFSEMSGTAAEANASAQGMEVIAGVTDKEPLVMLDPGHGGEDTGCDCTAFAEKEINLQITLTLQRKLEDMGYRVLLTRDRDKELSKEERVKFANESGADIFVSIHQNCEETKRAKGLEVWYCPPEETAAGSQKGGEGAVRDDWKRLAQLIKKYAAGETGAVERKLQQTDQLYVTRETAMPSCIVETGFLSNREESRKLSDPAYQEKLAAGIAKAIDLYFHPKTMYLTFDDGPSEENTGIVLDILKEKNIKATFFLVGENIEKHPEMARRIVREGHTVGIHCNVHDYKVIYKSAEDYVADFEEAYETLKRVTGVETKLFRFPGGSINAYNSKVYEEIIEKMTEKGFVYFDWNAGVEDAVQKRDPDTLLQNGINSTLGRKKVVMLAHDIIYETTLCLEELIEALPEYEMLPLTEEVTPIQF